MTDERASFGELEAYALAREAAYADLMRPPEPPPLWRDALEIIEREIPDISFKVWFRWTRLEHADDNRIVISAESSRTADWLLARYLAVIKNAFAKVGRQDTAVDIVVRPSPWERLSAAESVRG